MARGSRFVNIDELKQIGTPEPTHSYQPISHFDLSRSIRTISQDVLASYELATESYEVAQNDHQLFSVLSFSHKETDMRLAVGFRNSTNRSLSVGVCIGSQIVVCSNLMFSAHGGGIVVMRKHSKNLLVGLEDLTISTLFKAQYTFNQLIKDASLMKAITLTDDQAFQHLGRLYGHGVLSPRQMPVALEQWINPVHEEFRPRTLFSLYQAVTESLKTTPPANALETYILNHKLLLEVT
jgi:hypothetical protein